MDKTKAHFFKWAFLESPDLGEGCDVVTFGLAALRWLHALPRDLASVIQLDEGGAEFGGQFARGKLAQLDCGDQSLCGVNCLCFCHFLIPLWEGAFFTPP